MSEQLIDVALKEAYGDWVDPREPYYDSPGFGWLARKMGFYSRLDERLEGRFAPVYENELDLKAIRMAAWLMDAQVPVAKAMKARLTDYTIASGFDWSITHESPEVEKTLNRIVDTFMENVDWCDFESESFGREIVDGEFLAELIVENGEVSAEILEGDALTEPLMIRDIEEWQGIDYPTSWTFGVLTREGRAKPIGYHIVRNNAATDWDYVPERKFIHWKRNVTRNAKRGASDHYTTHKWLGYGNKLLSRTAQGAAIQASIAYIIEHTEGATKSQVEALANARNNIVTKRDPITGESKRTRTMQAGQVVEVKQGQKYHASLLGSNNSQVYIETMSALFRLSGTIYAFPEHMMTGFAGNNNMASSTTAESPFLQGRKHDQRTRAQRLKTMLMKVMRCGIEANPRLRLNWQEVCLGLDVAVTQPELVSRDIGALTTSLIQQRNAGWISDQMAVQELGRDFDDVTQQRSEEREAMIKRGEVPYDQRQPTIDQERLTETQKRVLLGWDGYP